MLLSANLLVTGLSDVGYQFFDSSETAIGARATVGVTESGDGWYSVNVAVPANAVSIRWNSAANTEAKAREYLDPRLDNLDATVSSRNAIAPDNSGIAAIKAKTDNLPASPAAVGSAMALTAGTRVQLATAQPDYAPAKAGDGMALTQAAHDALVAAVEMEMMNDGTGGQLMQAIADKLAAEFNFDELTVAAIATASRDALLNRVLAGNYDTAGTVGRLLQTLPSSGTVNTVEPDNLGIAAIKMKTDNLPANPAAVGSPMTLAPDQDIRNVLGTVNGLVAPDNVGIAAIRAKTDNLPAQPASSVEVSGIPVVLLDTLVAGHTQVGTVGGLINRLNLPNPEEPLIFVPGAPAEVGMCRVFAYVEDLGGRPDDNIKITFTLHHVGPIKGDKMVTNTKLTVTTNAEGRIVDSQGNPWIDLQRNDRMTPSGSYYTVSSEALSLSNKKMILAADTFDLASLVS